MFRRYVRLTVLIIAVGLTAVGAGTTKSAARLSRGEIANLAPQHRFVSNALGFTVADIYDRGVIVTSVEVGSPAAQAGILKDDVILEVNGEPVWTSYEFQKYMYGLTGPVTFTVTRFGQIRRFTMDVR